MKKTYINPTIKVVNIRPMNLLAGSPNGQDVYDEAASSGKSVLSRRARFSDWDFEEEE